LGSTGASARLQAAFALAFVGGLEEIGQLRALAHGDPDDAVRLMSTLAADVLVSRRPKP
jgi:hypothetical protein